MTEGQAQKHTQGRLELRGIHLHAEGQIVDCVAYLQGSGQANWHADGRRLAACWNACVGLHTESLERGKPLADQIVDALNEQADLRAKNNALQAEFKAYREGSEEAFGAVVDQKRDLEEKNFRQFETIQVQSQIIARWRLLLQEKGITP